MLAALACLFGLVAAFAAVPAGATAVIHAMEQAEADGAFVWRMRVDAAVGARVMALANPDRIVLDVLDAVPAAALPAVADTRLVSGVQHGLAGDDRYRLIFNLAIPAEASLRRVEEGEGAALELTLRPAKGRAAAVVGPASLAAEAAGETSVAGAGASEGTDGPRRHLIVVDAGHGGEDLGAEGAGGTLEKDVNLAFAMVLAEELESHGDIDVTLTRNDDTFIPLNDRADVGRRIGADLFISIHADSIRYPELRGATVYTLSARASDDLSRQVADSENAADRFGDASLAGAPEILDILGDLTRRETVGFSEHFAADLVRRLREADVHLIKNPKRSAGFRVLTAPDVPSVLVELGYLSNKQDEKLLKSDEWRRATAKIMGAAVAQYLKGREPLADRS